MIVEVGYAPAWDPEARVPWRPVSVREARERDAAGLPYVVVYRAAGREAPLEVRLVSWRDHYVGLWVDDALVRRTYDLDMRGCWTTRRGCCDGAPSVGTTPARKRRSSTTRVRASPWSCFRTGRDGGRRSRGARAAARTSRAEGRRRRTLDGPVRLRGLAVALRRSPWVHGAARPQDDGGGSVGQ